MKFRLFLAAMLVFLAPQVAGARGWACWGEAGASYNVPVNLLYAISRVESGNRAHIVGGINPDGSSYDIGLMQVNSGWLPRLGKYGITKEKLLADPCLNLKVGAWILATCFHDYGYNWRGLGCYNARDERKRAIYARRVLAELKKVEAEGYVDRPVNRAVTGGAG